MDHHSRQKSQVNEQNRTLKSWLVKGENRKEEEEGEAEAVIIGGMVLDIHATPSIPPNPRTTSPGKVRYAVGGVARNIAECVSKLGTKPYMISALGVDMAGNLLLEHWKSAGLSMEGIQRGYEIETPVVCIVFDIEGEPAAAVASVESFERFLTPKWIAQFKSNIASTPIVMVDANLSPPALQESCECMYLDRHPPHIPPTNLKVKISEQQQRDDVFLKDSIPSWFAASGYVCLAIVATATIPFIFPPLKWYLVLCSYIIAPALAFCNSYGTGLTDMSLPSTYGKIGLFIIASLVRSNGGVLAGLAECGVMMSIVSTAADLMQDFRTGYLTLSSAKSMFVSQLVGTAMGCIIAPLTFWLFWTAYEIGAPDSLYKAPYAIIYREMAILGVEGFSELPKHCLTLCCGFFAGAIILDLLRDMIPHKFSRFIPIPMAMAPPFYIGAYFAIDMFVGTMILFVWERVNRKDAEAYRGAVASGLICGDGIWTIPSAILSFFRIDPPICMYFGPASSG